MSSDIRCTPTTQPWLARTVRIVQITNEIDEVDTFRIRFEDPDIENTFVFRPGQFNMLYLPGVGEAAISISGDPSLRGHLDHTVRVAGNVTRELSLVGVNGTFLLRGPFGSAWPIDEFQGHEVIVVAGGIGLAPLRPAIYELLNRRTEFTQVTLFHGARTPAGLLYTREYDEWRSKGLNVQTTVDRATSGWRGNVGVVPQLLDQMRLDDPERTSVFCCGPEVMMWYTARSALELGIPANRIHLSLERNMNCAIGLCGHCQFGPTFVCKDGPIVPYDQVAPFLRVEGF